MARYSDGQIGWAFNTGTQYHWYGTGHKAPLDQWTHVVVIYDAGNVRTYINGALVHTLTVSGSVSNANYLAIGSLPVEGEFFTGMIDEVRLFGRALSPDEVKVALQRERAGAPVGLRAGVGRGRRRRGR